MKRFLVVFLTVCAAVAGWAWQRRAASAALTAEEVLSAIAPAEGPSPADKAIASWAESVRKDPRNDNAWAKLGEALMQKARDTMDVSYYSRADAVFRESLSLNGANVFALNGMAWVAGSRHDFDKSIEWAHRTIAIDPMNHAAYGLLGDAALEMGNYQAALKHYQKMLDIRPDLSSYSRGAYLLYLTGDTRKAAWLMQKAIAAGAPNAENTAWCRAQLALMYWNTGALLPAEQILEAGLQDSPDNYHLLLVSGKVKSAKKDYKAAMDFYRKAIAIAPHHEPLVALGDLYELAGAKDEAEKQFALVERIHALHKAGGVRGDMQMARFYVDRGRNLEASLTMAEAEYAKTPNVFAADTLAWCYYALGRYDDAKTAIRKALAQGTPDPGFLFHAGMIYAKLNERAAAQKYLYQAMSLNSNFHPVHAQLAEDTLKRLGMETATQ
jgi:tetratricopeptide (TPR) repeat protein